MRMGNESLQELERLARSLDLHSEGRFICPVCEGGSTRERSLSIRRDLMYANVACFRDSCSLQPFGIRIGGGAPLDFTGTGERTPARRRRQEQYEGRVLPAPPDWYEWCPSHIRCQLTDDGRIVIPIFDRTGNRRGDSVRQLKPYNTDMPKSLSLYEEEYSGMAWFRPETMYDGEGSTALVVVEDPLSAMRMAYLGYTGVALMGTGISYTRLRELSAENRPINLALDADAVLTAVRHARKYSSISRLHVHPIYHDVKDMNLQELRNFLGNLVV